MYTDWYWLHSLVPLLQQLVTECTGWSWLHSLAHLLQQLVTVYRLVLATQSCTLASTTTGYSVLTGTGYTVLYTCFNNWLQSVPAGTGYTALYTCFNNWLQCTDWYWLHSLVHLLQQQLVTVYLLVLATQPCTLASTTGYRVYRLVLATQPCFNNWLQCTDWYWLHSLVHLLQQQLVTVYLLVLATQPCTLASTTGYRVYRQVLATQPCTLASTTGYRVYRLVLATQSCTLASTYRLQVY